MFIKITKEQIESTIAKAHKEQNIKYGYDVDYWDYDLTFDKVTGTILLYITFSSGDVLDYELKSRILKV